MKAVRCLSRLVTLASATALVFTVSATPLRAGELLAADQEFLRAYTQIQVALAADDFAGAKAAAAALGDIPEAKAVANAANLVAAREGFGKLSGRAESLAQGQPGYHVFNCPMAKKDWVQAGDKVTNPYFGKSMLTCGVEKK